MNSNKFSPYVIPAAVLLLVYGKQIMSMLNVASHDQQINNLEKISKDQIAKNTVVVYKIYRDKKGKIIKQIKQLFNLETIARIIFESFYRNDILGYTENEARAIAAINNIPKEYIPRLSAVYLTIFHKQLAADFSRFLNAEQYNQVKAKFI
jgi:hypothetical protein